jgi:hypothetical protein
MQEIAIPSEYNPSFSPVFQSPIFSRILAVKLWTIIYLVHFHKYTKYHFTATQNLIKP